MSLLVNDFLQEVRQAASVASTSGSSPEGLTDSEILRVADREVQTSLVPLLVGVREEFYGLTQSVAYNASSTKRIRIPGRTIAGRVRDIRAVIQGGGEQRLVRYEVTDKPWISPLAGQYGTLTGYYLEGEWIVFLPPPNTSGTLKVSYFGAPGRMTNTSTDYRAITSVDTTTGAIGFASWTFSGNIDVVRGSSGFSALLQQPSYSGATTTSLTLSTDDASYCEGGDYVCVADTTPVVPLPRELHGVLLGRTVAALMRQMGKASMAQMEEDNANRLCDLAMDLLTPRVESAVRPGRGRLNWRTAPGGWGASNRWGW